MPESVKSKSLGKIVEDGFKSKRAGSFEAGAVTIQMRGNRVDIVPSEPIEPQPEVVLPHVESTTP